MFQSYRHAGVRHTSIAARDRLVGPLFSGILAITAASSTATAQSDGAQGEDFVEILTSEETVLALTPSLKHLSTDVLNLQLPHHRGIGLFAEQVTFNDLADVQQAPVDLPGGTGVQVQEWRLSETERSVPSSSLSLWQPLFDEVDYFEHGSFYFERGNFLDEKRERFEADVAFTGAARSPSGDLVAIEARINTHWQRGQANTPGTSTSGEASEVEWLIERWRLKSLTTHQSREALFTDVIDRVLPDPADRQQARQSIHEQLVIEWGKDLISGEGQFEKPHALFDISSLFQKPGIAVVDVDRDGFDDIYAMPTWGKNLLLHNNGNGTFDEMAAEVGLDIENHCSSAIFADFDNDGDADVFIGRTLEASRFFINDNGRFVDRSQTFPPTALPHFVTSISAVDFNKDGLLDVYFSTYVLTSGPLELRETLKLLAPAQGREMMQRRARGHRFRDHAGPPNVLLVNRGKGVFDIAAQSDQLAIWRNTFQSSWADYDGDGDQDLYAANDFAPNNMFRNDGGTFTDVTEETGTADIGFGMGVSWGDYDNDGRQDLYVCNMYSKAGQRIMSQIPQLDPRITMLAGGNSLFHNRGDHFEKVSGVESPALLVEKVGWAWGGQFADIDNDGFLDIYSLAGYYSAPEEIAVPAADL